MKIESYQNNFNNKEISIFKSMIVVAIFIIVLSLIIVFNNEFYNYYSGYGVLEKDNEISILIDINDLNKITNNNKIIIERTTFSYKIISIDEANIEYGNNILKKVLIEVLLTKELNIKNNYIKYKIITSKDTILNYILNTIKGE